MSDKTMLGCFPAKWRVVRLHTGVDFAESTGGGSMSFTNTYAIPDDGRDLMDMTLEELRAYPTASALALLDEIVANHPTGDKP